MGVVTGSGIASCDQRSVCVQLSNLTSLPCFNTFSYITIIYQPDIQVHILENVFVCNFSPFLSTKLLQHYIITGGEVLDRKVN